MILIGNSFFDSPVPSEKFAPRYKENEGNAAPGRCRHAALMEELPGCSLLAERHSRVVRTRVASSFAHPIRISSPSGVAGGIPVRAIVGCRQDQRIISVDIDVD
jgi:hypothetical protein